MSTNRTVINCTRTISNCVTQYNYLCQNNKKKTVVYIRTMRTCTLLVLYLDHYGSMLDMLRHCNFHQSGN